MKGNIINRAKGLYLITVVILLVGLGSAVLIYLTAENDTGSILGYQGIGGYDYPIKPEDSKTYRHALELYGGKWNLLADDFTHWFVGLWHGKSLAFTVACITLFTSFGLFFVARHLRSDSPPDVRDENKSGGA